MVKGSKNILKIHTFPKPYDFEYTIYRQLDFNKFCYENCDTLHIDTAKVIVIGDVSVGKTSLIKRIHHEMFATSYKPTIGMDVHIKRFKVLNSLFDLQIWDTAGQERFRSMALSYYRGAKVIIMVFDFRNTESLMNIDKWLDEALSVQESDTPYLFLVGSKMDLMEEQHDLNQNENIAKEKSRQVNAEYWSISSRTGKNVEDLFRRIAALLFDKMVETNNICLRRNVEIGIPMITVIQKNGEISKLSKCRMPNCVK